MTLTAFAVEPRAVQLVATGLPAGAHEVSVDGVVRHVDGPHGAVEIDGLEPATSYEARVDGMPAATFTTLAEPPGALLGRVATLSDIHLGEVESGHLPRVGSDPDPARAHPMLALRAAVAAVARWGADALVVKGDVSDDCTDEQFDLAAPLLAGLDLPTLVLPGNHDGGNHHHDDAAAALARHGLTLTTGVATLERPGLRLVAGSTVRRGHHRGWVQPIADALVGAVHGAGPCLVALHHQLHRGPIPAYVPRGVTWPHSTRLLDRVAAANPAVLVTSGHTHRHRRHRHGPLVVTEVGSTKDFPGTWGGYLVHEGGIVQVVRRIADPAFLQFSERVKRTALGLWQHWAPGRLDDRCFTHAWP